MLMNTWKPMLPLYNKKLIFFIEITKVNHPPPHCTLKMSASENTNKYEIIQKLLAGHIVFNNLNEYNFNKQVKAILNPFKTHLPDIKFVKMEDKEFDSIEIYTNYNFKFIMNAGVSDYFGYIPYPTNDGKYIVMLAPLEDSQDFFNDKEYIGVSECAKLIVNIDDNIVIYRPNKDDLQFDIRQCNCKKGIWPCVFTAFLVNMLSDDRDTLTNDLFDDLMAPPDQIIKKID